jgi:hypothetical protein
MVGGLSFVPQNETRDRLLIVLHSAATSNDLQEEALTTVLQLAELLCADWMGE